MFLRIYFRIRRRLKLLLFFIIGFILGFTISTVNAEQLYPDNTDTLSNYFYPTEDTQYDGEFPIQKFNYLNDNGILQDAINKIKLNNTDIISSTYNYYLIFYALTNNSYGTSKIFNLNILFFNNPLEISSSRSQTNNNQFFLDLHEKTDGFFISTIQFSYNTTTLTANSINYNTTKNFFERYQLSTTMDNNYGFITRLFLDTNFDFENNNINLITHNRGQYIDTDFSKYNLENLTQSVWTVTFNDNDIYTRINYIPYNWLFDFLSISNDSYIPPVTKINFSTEIDSIAFYKKDFSNIDIGDYSILHGLTLNGDFSYLDLNFNDFYDYYMNEDYYYLQDYLLQPPNYIETLSNRNNLWGVVSYSEPLYRLFPIEFNNKKVPLLKKNINYGEENNDSINNTYYIEFDSTQNLGYIIFNKDGEVIQTDLENNIISFIDTDNNVIDKDLSPNVDIPVVKNNWYNQLSTSLSFFTFPIMFIFSLISYIYFALPIFLQMFFIVLFGFGVVVFLLRVVI